MLETALVLVPFLALLFGIVDFGTSIFIRSTIQNATSTGVRYAITMQNRPGYCMDDSIRLAVQTAAMGFLGDTTTPNPAITVNYYAVADLSTPLGGAANQASNVVEVIANYQWKWLTNLSGTLGAPRSWSPLNIAAYSSDRLGTLAPGQLPPCR